MFSVMLPDPTASSDFIPFFMFLSDYYLFTDLQVLIDMAFIEAANKSVNLLPKEVGWKDNLDVVSCQKKKPGCCNIFFIACLQVDTSVHSDIISAVTDC